MCKHEWWDKPDFNEKFCPKCNRIEMLVTRRELLALPIEKRREILTKQSADFVKAHPGYFQGLLEEE